MQITTLGVSGSGKSNFMFTLFDQLYSPANAKNNFYLTSTSHAFNDALKKKKHSILKNRVFAEGTKAYTNRKFQLRSFDREWLTVNWFDYKGGIVNEYLIDEEEQQNKYFEILHLSKALIIFVNMFDLFNDFSEKDNRNEDYFTTMKEYVGATNITNVISMLNDYKHQDLDILFVLSQCDTVPQELWNTKKAIKILYEDVLIHVFGGAFEIIRRQKSWRCGFIPVSCVGIGQSIRKMKGKRNAQRGAIIEDEITGMPKPINILNAFFWLTKKELEKKRTSSSIYINDLEAKKRHLEKEMNKKIQQTKERYKSKKSNRPMLTAILEDKLLKDKNGKIRLDIEMESEIKSIKYDFSQKVFEVNNEIEEVRTSKLPKGLINILAKSTCAVYEL